MKNIRFILTFSLFYLTACTQEMTIDDMFLKLDSSYTNDLTMKERVKLLRTGKIYWDGNSEEEIIVYNLSRIEKKKDRFKMELSFESGQAAYINFEYRYFIKNTGDTILIYSEYGGTHMSYSQNRLVVFDIINGCLKINNENLLPEEISLSEFYKKNTPEDKMYKEYNYTYDLIYNKNDFVEYYLWDGANSELTEENEKYLIGDKIIFKWNGENFDREILFDN